MSAPPDLTPERMNGFLAVAAEACMEGIDLARSRMASAEDDAAFERDVRALNALCRNLRQTIALKQRFDREQIALARAEAEDARTREREARRAHEDAVGAHRHRVRAHFVRVLWNEYEQDDALEIMDEVDDRLDDLARDPGFLQMSMEALVEDVAGRLASLNLPGSGARPRRDAEPDRERVTPAEAAAEAAPKHDVRASHPSAPAASTTAPPAPPSRPPPPVPKANFEVHPRKEPPDPPEPPPDPPAAQPSYVPPWERLRPGQAMPGGSGW